MKNDLEIPRGKRVLPWLVGVAVGSVVWVAMLFLANASGALSIYVGIIIGFNAGAYVAAGVARPVEEEEEGIFLKP